jgi:tetratricopeptide (TPR) repeat protein
VLVAACGRGRKETGAPQDAAPVARSVATHATPAPRGEAADELGPDGRPVVPCPLGERWDLDAALDRSTALYEEGDVATSLACAELAARIAPRSVEAHHDRAIALAALGRLDEARQAFTLALAIDPDDPQTLAGAADLYVNRLGSSREVAAIGLEYARRGSSRMGRRRGDRGLAAHLALLEAQALDDLGRADEALPRAEAALALDPSSLDARYGRGVVLFHLCRFDGARRDLEAVLARRPDDAFAHHHLGLVLERLGRPSDADAHLARARRLAPEQFAEPVLLPSPAFRALVEAALAEIDEETRAVMEGVTIEISDLPALEDLLAVEPPFAPTILGLFRGPPLPDPPAPDGETRAIVLYRKNLGRAVRTREELERQVRITLWHEIGHLRGEDEDDLRARGLE